MSELHVEVSQEVLDLKSKLEAEKRERIRLNNRILQLEAERDAYGDIMDRLIDKLKD